MTGIGRPLIDGHVVSDGTMIDFSKFRNIASLPTTRLIPRASILILQQQPQQFQQQQQSMQNLKEQQQQQQQPQYRTNLKIDFDHGASADNHHHHHHAERGITTNCNISNIGGTSGGGYDKLSSIGPGNVGPVSSVGGSSRSDTVTSAGYEQVDKSLKLSLEPKVGPLDPLANAYMSMKNGRGDSKSDMIIVAPSTVSQSAVGHDREMVSR